MNDELVRIKNGSLFLPYDKSRRMVLQNINFELTPGLHTGLCGANGAGKSTFLNLVKGHLWLAAGEIKWRDGNVMSASRIVGQRICQLISPHIQLALQSYGVNIAVADFIAGREDSFLAAEDGQRQARALEILERMDSQALGSMRLAWLSRGQLRMALIGRALAQSPQILLLDEWNSGLDSHHAALMENLLKEFMPRMTMIFTGHRISSFPAWVKNYIYLQEGKISDQPAPCRDEAESGEKHPDYGPDFKTGNKPLYFLKNASVYIDRKLVLKNICWTMKKGEHWRICGANGSGKTTLLRLLAGEEHCAAGGECTCFSAAYGEVASQKIRRKVVSLVTDLTEAHYDYPLTALETVLSGFDGSIGLWRKYESHEIERARQLLGRFLPGREMAEISIRKLSTGQLRKVFLARALVGNPEIILLDEPFSGLDAASRKDFKQYLNQLAFGFYKDALPGLIMVSHFDEDIPEFVNRQAYIRDGRLQVII